MEIPNGNSLLLSTFHLLLYLDTHDDTQNRPWQFSEMKATRDIFGKLYVEIRRI